MRSKWKRLFKRPASQIFLQKESEISQMSTMCQTDLFKIIEDLNMNANIFIIYILYTSQQFYFISRHNSVYKCNSVLFLDIDYVRVYLSMQWFRQML